MSYALMPLAAAVGGLCVVLLAWGWRLTRSEPAVPAYLVEPPRQGPPLPKERRGPLTALFQLAGRPFAGTLRNVLGRERVARARRRVGSAGLGGVLPMETYLARKAGSIVVFGVVGVLTAVSGHWLVGLLLVAFGWFWFDLWLLARSRRRQDEIERSLPDFLDVLAVTVSAGLGFRTALQRVCESMPGALAEEFTVALRQMELGTSRREAFQQLRGRSTTPALDQFITAILQAEELGAPLAQALIDISVDMRSSAAQRARRKAARTAPRIQLVVTFLMVPAALILLLGVILIGIAGGTSGVLG